MYCPEHQFLIELDRSIDDQQVKDADLAILMQSRHGNVMSRLNVNQNQVRQRWA
jgi:hypothetical protein